MNLEQAFHYAEYLSHTYCYPEFLYGELSEKEQKRTDQCQSQVQRSGEGQAPMSALSQSQHREARRATRVSKL
jgi:hypothetical protein